MGRRCAGDIAAWVVGLPMSMMLASNSSITIAAGHETLVFLAMLILSLYGVF